MSKIMITLSGWCEADPEKVRFQLISGHGEEYITGTEWLTLPECHLRDEVEHNDNLGLTREDYILECAGEAFATAIDGEYDYVDVEVEE